MTSLVWAVWRLLARPQRLPDLAYWCAVLLAALLFALGHLPILFAFVPSPPGWLIMGVIGVNLLAGIGFGHLFWRHGLEAAILGHALSHVVAGTAGHW